MLIVRNNAMMQQENLDQNSISLKVNANSTHEYPSKLVCSVQRWSFVKSCQCCLSTVHNNALKRQGWTQTSVNHTVSQKRSGTKAWKYFYAMQLRWSSLNVIKKSARHGTGEDQFPLLKHIPIFRIRKSSQDKLPVDNGDNPNGMGATWSDTWQRTTKAHATNALRK